MKRNGLAIIEVLVMIAIFAVLVALITLVVSAARESAKRARENFIEISQSDYELVKREVKNYPNLMPRVHEMMEDDGKISKYEFEEFNKALKIERMFQ